MNKMRVLISIVLVLAALAAGCAFAEGTEITLNGIVYTLNGDGTATVTGYTQEAPDMVEIPETVEGNSVVAIGNGAFKEFYGLYSLTLPASVTTISEGAFEDCYIRYMDTQWTEEKTVAFLEQLGDYIYVGFAAEEGSDFKMSIAKDWEGNYHYGLVKYLGSASDLILPEEHNGYSIKEIGPDFAKGNSTIQNLVIPKSYWSCGDSAFENCTALKTVDMRYFDIPYHANRMFAGCTALEEVILNTPWEGGPSLGNYMFDGCTSLRKVTFPYGMVEYDGDYYECAWEEWGNYTFRNCINLETIELNPAMPVHCLEEGTFQNCKKLSYLACSNKMNVYFNEMDARVSPFDGCSAITLGVFHGSPMETFALENEIPFEYLDREDNEYFFYSVNEVKEESIITGLKQDMSGEVIIPDTLGGYSVGGLNNYLFKNQTGITGVIIPDTVNYIGVGCFSGCSGLSSVRLPAALEYLEGYLFENCTGLREVYLPDYLWWIDETAFEGCSDYTLYVTEGSGTQSLCDEDGIEYVLLAPAGIVVDFERANLRLGDVFKVYVHREDSVVPMDGDKLICESSDEDIVSVDDNIFTAVGEGEATLTFTTLDSSESSASCEIVIGGPVMVFPGDISCVEAEAFAGDENLCILVFTNTESVSIEENAFSGCTNLSTVYFAAGESCSIAEGALPDGVMFIYEGEAADYMPISLVQEG